ASALRPELLQCDDHLLEVHGRVGSFCAGRASLNTTARPRREMGYETDVRRLELLCQLHADLDACTACEKMIGPVVHGPPVLGRVILVGQAPGPREGSFGRPFAWTAGRTLFRWFEESMNVSEEEFRSRVYMAAVARCFPGKAKGGGDRKPDAEEIARCKPFL